MNRSIKGENARLILQLPQPEKNGNELGQYDKSFN
jgi:hypothetical protein